MGEFEDKKTFCRLCLCIINSENFKTIDEIIKGVFDSFQLKLCEQENDTSVICNACFTKLFAAFNFKAVCTDTEDCIMSYLNSECGPSVGLREIYLKENGKQHLTDILKDETICRLCMHVTCEFTSANEMDLDTFHTYIPEVNFNSTKEPVVCKDCLDSSNSHTSFFKQCFGVEEKGKNISEHKFLESPFDISTDKIEIKYEEIYTETSLRDLKDESLNTGDGQPESVTTSNTDAFDAQMYNCNSCHYKTDKKSLLKKHEMKHKRDLCDYKTVYRNSFVKHQLKHKDISEELMYKCNLCGYKTNHKTTFTQHELRHRNVPEDEMHKCHLCNYKSPLKKDLKKHQLIHRDILEDRMYKCNWCEYKTNIKNYLTRHERKHKDIPEEEIFKCRLCNYKTIYSSNLTKHQRRHKDYSKGEVYRCDSCDYKTGQKRYLTRHQLRHKNIPEDQMYQCYLCDYKTVYKFHIAIHQQKHKTIPEEQMYRCDLCCYKTRQKRYLKEHQLKHTDISEDQMFKCDSCDYKTIYKNYFKRHQLRHPKRADV